MILSNRKVLFTEIILVAVLAIISMMTLGCTTSPADGSKMLAGVIKIPFTKNVEAVNPEAISKLAMVDQFAPFIWASLFCIVGGASLWWFTKGSTGAGKFFVALGICLSAFAVLMQKYAGVIGLIALVASVGLIGWMIYDFIIKKKSEDNPPE